MKRGAELSGHVVMWYLLHFAAYVRLGQSSLFVMTVFKKKYIVIAKFEFNSYACYISIRITYFKRLHVLVTHASSKTRHVQRFECGSEDDFWEHFEPQVRSLLAHNFLSRPIQMLLATNFPVNVR